MKERLVHQINLTGKLRKLSLLLALLLLPIGVWAENYDLWIGETQVTDDNKTDVLNDGGTVVFSVGGDVAVLYTLTLNGATLTAPIKIGLPDLTIDIQGTNTITTTEECIQKMDNTNPSITFKSTSTEVGSLSLYGSSGVYGVGYGSFTISDQFAVILKYYDRYYSNTYHFTDGSTTEALLTPSYGITVGGMQIGEGNADKVTGDGIGDGSVEVGKMVSFDKTTNTLTLNGATIDGKITYNGTSNLTIAFSGTNSVTTSESSAIQYEGSESVRPKLTFSSTNGTLTINGESIERFSDVDFGSLNLASISAQGVYYDTDGFLMRGHGTTPSDLTITTETYYPIWIYDPSLSNTAYSHTQLRRDSTVTVGDGTVSFDGDHTITISNVNFNYEGNALVVVGPSMTALTVDLVGQSTATSGCTVLSLWDTTPLTFTTDASTPGSLTGYGIVSWNGSGNEQISYENGLRAFYDVKESYKETISTTGTYIKIGDTPVSATGTINIAEGTAYFDATSNTLTLTDATIGKQGAETGTDIQVLVDDLTIEISGTNTIYGNIMYNGSNYRSSNIQINKASSAESASLTATNVNGFSGCTWGDGLYLSALDGQGATIDVHYEHYDGEGGLMESYYGGDITDVTFSTTATNAIWVAGTQVTSTNAGNIFAGDETNDSKVSYDFDTHTLTLDGASLYTNENYPSPMIISQGALNVLLKGGSYISFNGNYSTYVFKNTGSSGALTISAYDDEASLGVTSGFYDGDYKGLCDGFSQVNFNNDLGLFNKAGTKAIENITGHAPSFYVDNGTSYWQTNNGLLLNATYYYKIDYVDDTIEGSGEEVSLATDETNWGFGGASFDISDLAGPCTITAYAKLNGNTIGSNKAKLFTSNPSPFRLVYGADPVDLVLAPAIEESDGISITGIEANVTYNEETGKISSETLGSFGGPVAMSSEGTAILNNYFTMNFEVVPPAPTIVFDETKEYLNTDVVSITMPEVLAEDQNARIMYSWVEDCEDGNGSNYTDDSKVTLTAGTGTLYAWVRYNSGTSADDALYSERVSQVFTVKSDISEAYIPEFTTTATYTGEAIVPAFTVYDSEKTMEEIPASNYTVSYQKSASTHMEDVDAIVEVGTYVITITGTGDTWGGTKTVTREFTVVYPTLNVEFAQGQTWATYYNAEERMDLPEGVNAYVVTDVSETTVSVQAISYVPQGIAVLLEQSTTVPENVVNSMTGINSLLIGTSEDTDVSSISDGTVYVLYNGEFVKSVSGTIPAGRGYLVVSGAVAALGARSLSIVVGDATGISATLMNKETMNKAVYNLQGQRMDSLRRGLNIVDGKKVFIK